MLKAAASHRTGLLLLGLDQPDLRIDEIRQEIRWDLEFCPDAIASKCRLKDHYGFVNVICTATIMS
jgi:hypothetical protein